MSSDGEIKIILNAATIKNNAVNCVYFFLLVCFCLSQILNNCIHVWLPLESWWIFSFFVCFSNSSLCLKVLMHVRWMYGDLCLFFTVMQYWGGLCFHYYTEFIEIFWYINILKKKKKSCYMSYVKYLSDFPGSNLDSTGNKSFEFDDKILVLNLPPFN